jgi:hypothetical protein
MSNSSYKNHSTLKYAKTKTQQLLLYRLFSPKQQPHKIETVDNKKREESPACKKRAEGVFISK